MNGCVKKVVPTFAAVLFHTVTSCPDLMRFIHMPWPMMPKPIKPIFRGVGMIFLGGAFSGEPMGSGGGGRVS